MSLQELSEGSNNLTEKLPRGGSSIIVQENAGRWRAFTEVTYQGAYAILEPGKRYESLEEMGLGNPVKSFRKEFWEVLQVFWLQTFQHI